MKSELTRIVAAGDLDRAGECHEIEASATERAALVRRLGLIGLDRFSATIELSPEARGARVRLDGTIRAAVTQTCVVSLAPVPRSIEESFTVLYSIAAGAHAGDTGDARDAGDIDAEDSPEALADGVIDIGEAATQQLILALDPYPRRRDAAAPDYSGAEGAGAGSPFAALAALKDKS